MDDITGTITCTCGTHMITVHADQDDKTPVEQREIDLVYWRRGSDFNGSPPWRMRLRFAWLWLRGEPESAQGLLLDRQAWTALVDALHEGARLTWGGHAVGEDDA